MPGRFYRYDNYYPTSRPIPTDHGIKAKSKRGKIAITWWGARFIQTLETFGLGNRLQRGKRYARQGQVLSISFLKGQVIASVQGSRRKPYTIKIQLPKFSVSDWNNIISEISKKALYTAQFLLGEMPDIDKDLVKIGYHLFPRGLREINANCSCPDYANPCKHIAAVYYLVAEKFDDNPFLLLELRGIAKEDFLEKMKKHRIIYKGSNKSKQSYRQENSYKRSLLRTNIHKNKLFTFWETKHENKEISSEIIKLNVLEQIILEQFDNYDDFSLELLKHLKKQLAGFTYR